ncbi:hypothetical protein C8A01DRAFT_19603 [Parachaetomium inaequale]|uniref:Uncharacterized protein n=1 Tax=Parachaetomium inaequale TaxID=2588326 RepID=A0AAN6SN48_9PEZI|nr:hypothetical protein C8A01DRAFT_19603 [Parachaetomium inaequale]
MRRRIWISLLSLAHFCFAQRQCFYPNGQLAANDFPCDSGADESPCCGGSLGTVCLTNKLCRGADGNIIRGSCTDKNWNSPECAQYCLSARTGGTDLISCSNSTGTDTAYCCDRSRAFCCDEGVARFDVFPSNPQVLANWDDKATAYVTVKRATTSSSATSTSPSSPTSTTLSTTTATTTTTTTTPLGPVPTPSSGLTTQSQPSQQVEPSGLPVAAQAGIGAGAGVLAIALAAVAFLAFKLRKNKRAMLAEKERQNQHQHQQRLSDPREYKFGDGVGEAYQGGQHAFGVVPRQEMDAWSGNVTRVELPSTPSTTPGMAFSRR